MNSLERRLDNGKAHERRRIGYYGLYKLLIGNGLSQAEIARKIGITRQGVNDYLKNHPELSLHPWKKGRREGSFDLKKHKRIERLINQGFTTSEIARKEGYSCVVSFFSYLYYHPELPRPVSESKKIYKEISRLIESGLNQTQIAARRRLSQPACVSFYLKLHPELRRKYREIRGIKK